MREFIIQTRDLEKTYRKKDGYVCVVRDINIGIHEKELVSLMGPSGCGKSTLLKMLGGITEPTSGNVTLGDNVYDHGIPRSALRSFGFVFERDNLLPWRTVKKNLDLPLEIMGLKGQEWERRISELLDMVGLGAYSDEYPHKLSGGMRQRIGVIRALVHDPDVLLMDHPFGALDAITRRMLAFEFLALWQKTQKTIFMVTNDIDEALLLSSRIYVMSACPGVITHEIAVDIPLSARNIHIAKNSRYNELRRQMKFIFNTGREIEAPCGQ